MEIDDEAYYFFPRQKSTQGFRNMHLRLIACFVSFFLVSLSLLQY